MSDVGVKEACGDCKFWTEPSVQHKLGPCVKKGENLSTPKDWWCKDFEATVARRLVGAC